LHELAVALKVYTQKHIDLIEQQKTPASNVDKIHTLSHGISRVFLRVVRVERDTLVYPF